MHGDADCFISPAQSESLYDALTHAGVDATLRLVGGVDHDSTFWSSAAEFRTLRRPRAQRVEDLALRREAPFILLGEDLLVVHGHDEDAAAAANELTVDTELFLDFSRQTGGSRKVVSNAAVVDPNVHDTALTRMAVTLSRPPRSFASSINF